MNASLCRKKGLLLIANKIVAVITLIFFSAGTVFALPAGQQVVNGQASFITQSNNLTITNSPNAIINWQGFSINNNEAVRFIQQYSSSSVLNRVIGQDPSRILGLLQSNGRVFLINPNGILFGQGARIDVNGLFASTLAISNQDFLAGKFNFSAGAVAGSIQNQGTITTPAGGKVYLIAPDIENSGIINSPQGEVLLAAGHSVQLVDSLNPDIAVVISAPENKAVNLGQIVAQSGKVGIYGGLISQKGMVNADSAVIGENGKIIFKATKDITLDAGSAVSAQGPQGGQITIQGESGTTLVSGTVNAAGNDGKGGNVQILGNHVGLIDNARIDVSGTSGGGTVLVGGAYQGKNADIQNAQATYVGKDTVIKADATANGDGGKVILWSNEATRAYGRISAKGGLLSGNGGFVETSGGYLDVNGIDVNTAVSKGRGGTWLLDPSDITITSTGTGALTAPPPPYFYDPGTAAGSISWSTIEGGLAGANVTVQTTSGTGGNGDITADNGYNFLNAGAGVLTLNAGRDITLNTLGLPLSGNPLGLTLQAGRNVAINNNISIAPLNVTASTGDVLINAALTSSTITASGKNIAVSSTGSINSFGTASLTATAGSISLNNSALAIGASTLNLNAVTGIYGSSSVDPLRTKDPGASSITINASNSGAGPIRISNSSYMGGGVGSGGLVQLGFGQPISISSTHPGYNFSINGPVTSNNGDIALTTPQGMSFSAAGPVSSGSGKVTLQTGSGQTLNMSAGSNITTTSGNIDITAGDVSLVPVTGEKRLNSGTGVVSFTANNAAGTATIGAGTPVASTLSLEASELPLISANHLSFSGSGSLTVTAIAAGSSDLTLKSTAGAINGGNIVAASLTANAATGINLFGDVPSVSLVNQVSGNVLYDNTGAGTVTINGSNAGGNFNVTSWNGGDINVGLIDSGTGNVSIETYNNIHNANAVGNASTNIIGNQLYLYSFGDPSGSPSGIGSGNALNTKIGILDVENWVGNVQISNTGALTINNVSNNGSDIIIDNIGALTTGTTAMDSTGKISIGATGNITLYNTITSSALSGNAIVLASGANFINNTGAAALNPGSGRWLVWSVDPSGDTRGGLAYNFKQYNAQYGITTVQGSGNGFLYSVTPTVGANLTGSVTKTYDATLAATLNSGNYSVSGAIDGDAVVLNYPTTGNFDTKNFGSGKTIAVNGITLASASNGTAPVYGYGIGSASASGPIGSITTAPLTLTTGNVTKTYDGTLTAAGAATVTSGTLFSGDTLSGGTFAFTDKNVGINNKTVTTTGVTVGDGVNTSNYNVSYADNTTSTINPYPVSLTGSRTYDGTANVTASTLTLGPLVTTPAFYETLFLNGSGTMVDKNAGTGKTVNVSGLTLADGVSGGIGPPPIFIAGLASNYTFTGGTQTVNITPATIANVTGITANSKTYDGKLSATLVTTGAGFTNMLAGDSLSVGAATGLFSDKDAGTAKTVNISGIALGGADAGNYTLTSTTASTTADIAKAAIANVTGITANNKPYDGTTNATLVTTGAAFTNMIAGDILTVGAATGAFSDKTAGTAKTVNISGITLGGVDAGNYTLTSTTATTTGVIDPGQTVSGKLDVAAAGKTISFAVNGTLLPDSASTDTSGNYSAMFPLNSIPSNNALLAYVANDSSVKSASVYLVPGGNITNLLLSSNTVTAAGGTMSNAALGTAKGELSSGDIPYSVSGANLTLSPGFNFKTAGETTYSLDGSITTTNGAHTYGGPVTLLGNAVLSAGTGNISFGGSVAGTGRNLTLNTTGIVTQAAPLVVSGLELLGAGGTYNLPNTGNSITTLAGNTGTVNFANGAPFAVGTVNTVGLTTSGDITLNGVGHVMTTDTSPVISSGGTVSITAHSPLTIGTGGVAATGSISLAASPGTGSDNLTINGSIASSNGSILLSAGSSLILGPFGSFSAPNGTITLNGAPTGNAAAAGNQTATDNTVSSLLTAMGKIESTLKGDDDNERKKQTTTSGEQTTDDKKMEDSASKYCN